MTARSWISIEQLVSTGKVTNNRGLWIAKIFCRATDEYITNVTFYKNLTGFYYRLNIDFKGRARLLDSYRDVSQKDDYTDYLTNIKQYNSVYEAENELKRLFKTSIIKEG